MTVFLWRALLVGLLCIGMWAVGEIEKRIDKKAQR